MNKSVRNFKAVKILMTLAVVFVMSLAVGSKSEAAGAPAKVTGLRQIYASTSAIELEWNALLENNVDYEVDISTNKVNWVNKEDSTYGNNSEYISNLSAGTTYYVRVRAYIQEGYNAPKVYGTYSSVLEVVTTPNENVSAIKHTKSTGKTISLSWNKVRGANCYRVEYRNADSSSNAAKKVKYVTGTSTTLTKLSTNKEYDIWVYPARQTSNGAVKAIGSYKPKWNVPVVPGKTVGVGCEYYWNNIGEIKMECSPKKTADGYQWELYTGYKSKNTKLKTVYTSSNYAYIKHSYLKKYNFYKVRVRAYCKTDSGKKYYGSWSSWDFISQQPDMKLKNSSKGIKASWDKIKGADRYVVYVSTKQKSGYKKFCTTKGTSKTITKYGKSKLKSGKSYYVYVVAQNKSGKTYYSGEADYCWRIKYRK